MKRRLEVLLSVAVLASLALAIVLARPTPPDQALFGAGPELARTLGPLELPAGTLTLAGRVSTADGRPAPEAFVVLLPPDDEHSELPPLHHAYSDAEGRFALEGLPAGPLRVVLSHPSAPPRTFALELPVEGEVAWSLAEPLPELPVLPPREASELSGLVRTDEQEGAADLTGFEVWLVPAADTPLLAGASERRTSTDAQGAFAFAELTAAGYEARVLPPWARGGTWPILARGRVTVRAGEPHSLGLALEVGAVEGTLLDPGGRPLPGAVVSVAALAALDPVGQPALWPPAVTDAQGRFRVGLLPPGRYLVHVRAGAARGDSEVVVEAGLSRSVPFGALDPRTDEGPR
ncbi:MAG TPA: carboxypeptidase-like regulatory domain-containing protein [Planctomycetota bacterium]